MIHAYTDGATRPRNPGPGGYGVTIATEHEIVAELQGYLGTPVTNNQCEYVAIIAALDWLLEHVTEYEGPVTIYSDSLLAVKQLSREWAMSSPKLRTLWKEALAIKQELDTRAMAVKLQHVRGHVGIAGNERADYLASRSVTDRVPCDERYITLVDMSEHALTGVKGYKALATEVEASCRQRGWLTCVYPSLEDPAMKQALHTARGLSSTLLLRKPSLITMTPSGPTLMATQTSFIIRPGESAKRVISTDMWESLDTLYKMGHEVYIIHRPFANGAWRTHEDLRWPEDLEVEAVIASVGNIEVTKIAAPAGWSDTYEMRAQWRKFETWQP